MTEKVQSQTFCLEDFVYDLPEELIAQHPPAVRHGSRLMLVERSENRFTDKMFTDLPELLQPGDVLVVNDTKVIPARLHARRQTGGLVEILLLRPLADRAGFWVAMGTPLRKLKEGETLQLIGCNGQLRIEQIITAEDGQKRLLLDFGSQAEVYRILSEAGSAPLPPYIHRDTGEAVDGKRPEDLARYQTIFAQAPGAVAAPTAGLHFSEEIFERLAKRGVDVRKITLHVGPGTFKPITSSLENHSIESEQFSISQETADVINAAKADRRRVIAVGTTSCRALESAGKSGTIVAVQDSQTALYIQPGFRFRIIDGLITNFHLSRSSLLVLVSALAGHDLIMRAYTHAVSSRYRFFSYGDAMLIM